MQDFAVLKVNDQELILKRMFSLLRFSGVMPELGQSLVTGLVIRQEARELGLSVSDEELQKEVNELRYQFGLESVEDTFRWLEQNNLAVEDLEAHCECAVRAKKFRDNLSQGKVDEFFIKNRLDFETAYIAQIVVDDEQVAQEIALQLKNGETNFGTMAKNYSQDPSARWGGYVGPVKRSKLKPEFEAAIFSVKEGDTVGPLKSERGFHIINVLAHQKPELSDETREIIKDKLLADWVQQKLKKSVVQFLI